MVIWPPEFGGSFVVSVQLKDWALHVQWVSRLVRRFSRWMQFLFTFPECCIAWCLTSSFHTRGVLMSGPCPLLQGASICLGGCWWWFFCTRRHSGCGLYYCLYSCGWCYNEVGLFSPPGKSCSGAKLRLGFGSGVWSSLLALHMGTDALV